MLHERGLDLLVKLCKSLELEDDCIPELVDMLIAEGGIDTEKLTFEMVLRGLRREQDADWHQLGFSARELLSYYRAMGTDRLTESFREPKPALVAVMVVMLAATHMPSGIGTGYQLPGICFVLHALRDTLYFDFDDLFCWVAAEVQHTEPLKW